MAVMSGVHSSPTSRREISDTVSGVVRVLSSTTMSRTTSARATVAVATTASTATATSTTLTARVWHARRAEIRRRFATRARRGSRRLARSPA